MLKEEKREVKNLFQRRDKYEGYDFHRDEEMQYNASGKYSTHLYAEEAVRLIRERELKDHTDRKPFFLYLPFQALHAPMQVTKTNLSSEPAISGAQQVLNHGEERRCKPGQAPGPGNAGCLG